DRGVPVDGVDLGRTVGPQVAVARAEGAGGDTPRVDGGHAVQVELGSGRGVTRRRAAAGLEVDELGAALALVHGVDAAPDHAPADNHDERRLYPDGIELGVGTVEEGLLQRSTYVDSSAQV